MVPLPSFTFFNPVRLHFGEGRFADLGTLCQGLGKRALLVTGRSAARKHGYIGAAIAYLDAAGIECATFEEAPSNPTDEAVDAGGAFAREAACDFVIGLGGGSAMDAAKAIAVAATHPEPIREYLRPGEHGEQRKATAATLPVACVTTTAGTSSELTAIGVITITATREKAALISDFCYPRVAICDPELTYTKSSEVTAATGVDVLCHSLEGFISNAASPIGDLHAQEAIALVQRYLPVAFADGDDREARRMMALANVHAGYTLSNCGATVLHGLEHPISGRCPHVAHGAGLAALMPAYCRVGWQGTGGEECPVAAAKFARLSELLGGAARPEAAEEQIAALLRQVGLNVRLRDLGVAEDMLSTLADDALRYMGRALDKTPCGAGREMLLKLLEASW